ncbi:MAG: hypothetical protein ABS939_09650 [Psychrobacillus sp.]
MRNRKFKEYNALLCVKINLFTAIILFILFVCSMLLTEKIQNNVLATVHDLGIDNGVGAMMAIVLIGGLVGILLVSYSILVPLIIPLFSNFTDNLKSLFGLVICNFGIGYYLFSNLTLQLALYYFLTVSVGMYFSMYFRYRKINSLEMKV